MAAKNPILTDPAVVARFAALPPDARLALRDFTRWLYGYAGLQSELSWKKRKAPMAVYWASVKAWSFHLARILK